MAAWYSHVEGITESKESELETRMVRESTKEKVRTRLSLKESLGIEVATTYNPGTKGVWHRK